MAIYPVQQLNNPGHADPASDTVATTSISTATVNNIVGVESGGGAQRTEPTVNSGGPFFWLLLLPLVALIPAIFVRRNSLASQPKRFREKVTPEAIKNWTASEEQNEHRHNSPDFGEALDFDRTSVTDDPEPQRDRENAKDNLPALWGGQDKARATETPAAVAVELDKLKELNQQLREQLENVQQENEHLLRQIQDLELANTQRLSASQSENFNLKSQLETTVDQLAAATAERNNFESQLNESLVGLAEKQCEIDAAMQMVPKAAEQQWQEKLAGLQQRYDALQTKLDQQADQMLAIQSELERSQQKLVATQSEVDDKNREIRVFAAHLKQKKEKIALLRTKLKQKLAIIEKLKQIPEVQAPVAK